jgi:hypothetical protein
MVTGGLSAPPATRARQQIQEPPIPSEALPPLCPPPLSIQLRLPRTLTSRSPDSNIHLAPDKLDNDRQSTMAVTRQRLSLGSCCHAIVAALL